MLLPDDDYPVVLMKARERDQHGRPKVVEVFYPDDRVDVNNDDRFFSGMIHRLQLEGQ